MRIFQDLEITESTGHGTLRIIESYGENVFEFADSFINVVIPFNKDVLNNRKNEDVGLDVGLNDTKRNIIGEIIINPQLSQKEIAEKLKCSERTINRNFIELKNENIISRVGSRRNRYWKLLKFNKS